MLGIRSNAKKGWSVPLSYSHDWDRKVSNPRKWTPEKELAYIRRFPGMYEWFMDSWRFTISDPENFERYYCGFFGFDPDDYPNPSPNTIKKIVYTSLDDHIIKEIFEETDYNGSDEAMILSNCNLTGSYADDSRYLESLFVR